MTMAERMKLAKNVQNGCFVRYMNRLGKLKRFIKGYEEVIIVEFHEEPGNRSCHLKLNPNTYVEMEEK